MSIWSYSSSVRINLLNFAHTDPYLATNESISALVTLIKTAAVENEVCFPNTNVLRIRFMCSFLCIPYLLWSYSGSTNPSSFQYIYPNYLRRCTSFANVFTTLACRPSRRFSLFLSGCWRYLDRIRALPLPALRSSDTRIRPIFPPLIAMRSLLPCVTTACYDSLVDKTVLCTDASYLTTV